MSLPYQPKMLLVFDARFQLQGKGYRYIEVIEETAADAEKTVRKNFKYAYDIQLTLVGMAKKTGNNVWVLR